MIDGDLVVDAHMHVPRLSTLKPAWLEWAREFSRGHPWRSAYDDEGNPVPEKLDALLEAEGVDRALLFCEYSPRATGIQPIEDNLPLVEFNPQRFRLVANVNPHLHHPLAAEVERQLALGAVALKIHPVHGAFSPADKELYTAYQVCAERGVPVILHSGVSSFPGARAISRWAWRWRKANIFSERGWPAARSGPGRTVIFPRMPSSPSPAPKGKKATCHQAGTAPSDKSRRVCPGAP